MHVFSNVHVIPSGTAIWLHKSKDLLAEAPNLWRPALGQVIALDQLCDETLSVLVVYSPTE